MGNNPQKVNVHSLLQVIDKFVERQKTKQSSGEAEAQEAINSLKIKFKIGKELAVIKGFVKKFNNPNSNEDALAAIDLLGCLFTLTCGDIQTEGQIGVIDAHAVFSRDVGHFGKSQSIMGRQPSDSGHYLGAIHQSKSLCRF